MRASLFVLSILLIGCGTKPGPDDTGDTPVEDTDDTVVADTDVADTDAADTDAADTDQADTDGVDTDQGDTDAPDTDAADTDTGHLDTDSGMLDTDTGSLDTDTVIVDTDVVDTDVLDTDTVIVDTDVVDTDTVVVDTDVVDTDTAPPDSDLDGVPDALDCAPNDSNVFPGAPEACGEERDCDPGTFTPCTTTFADAHPIFRAHCTPCHSTGGSGSHNIAASNISTAYSESQRASYYAPGETKGYAALQRILNGSMPAGGGCTGNPVTDAGNAHCLTASEQATLQAWIDDGQLR